MFVVRDVFRLEFGKAKEAMALWKEGESIMRQAGMTAETRLLTDFAGVDYYTLILELSFPNLAEYEKGQGVIMGSDEWREWYQRFLPLARSGHREILKVVE
jgi:hypothetical protein